MQAGSHRLVTAAASCALAVAILAGAPGLSARVAGGAPAMLTPVTQSVLSQPRWYPGDDGRLHVQYELLLTNTVPIPVAVTALEVLDGKGRSIETLSGDRLEAGLTLLGEESKPATGLPASTSGVAWLDLSFAERRQLPEVVQHRLTVDVGPGLPVGPAITYTGARAAIAGSAPVAIGQPLLGGRWVAIAGPSGPHRRALQAVNGALHNGQRFAVDFSALLDADGRTHVGGADQNARYLNYGEPVLAVGAGTIAEAVDGLPDQIPNHNVSLPPAESDGNHVILRLGPGVFVGYGHLRPGSVRVKPGERVRAGQILGELGNSGQSTGPHLHLQVMNRPSFLDADGLPFVFRRFDLAGFTPSLEAFLDADLTGAPVPVDSTTTGTRHAEGLTGLEVLRFAARRSPARSPHGVLERANDTTSTSESVRIDRTITYIREHNQDVNTDGQSGPAGPYPALPYLLVGVRGSDGYRGYVGSSSSDTPASAAASVGSSTKSFTAALVLQLDQEGTLSIDDTLADPRWRDVIRWPGGEKITLRMLLAHTSGIADYEGSGAFAARKLDPDWDPTPEEVIAFARALPPLFEPDAGWAYSNTGYQILGLVIEAVTGTSYAAELERRLVDPLGLEHTYLYGHQEGSEPQASYFLWCEGMPPPKPTSPPAEKIESEAACLGKKPPAYLQLADYYANDEHKLAWADGGIVSTAEDMTSWITKLVASDEVLDEAHRALMQQATPQSVEAIAANTELPAAARRHWTGYGLGLQVYRYDAGPGFGHGGNIEGFSSNAAYLPGHGNDFAIELIAPLFQADSSFDSSNRIASAVAGQRNVGAERTALAVTASGPPLPVTGSDGRERIEYDLILTNALDAPVTLRSIDILDERGRRLLRLEADALADATHDLFRSPPTTTIPASATVATVVDLVVSERARPRRLTHRIAYDLPPGAPQANEIGSLVVRGPSLRIPPAGPVVIAPPLRGPGWLTINGCCEGGHREAVFPANGRFVKPETFAVDWVRVRDGRLFVGDGSEVSQWFGERAPLLAVANGTVVRAVDGRSEVRPTPFGTANPQTPNEFNGNHVVIRLRSGVYAF